jgi:hypothetical protein
MWGKVQAMNNAELRLDVESLRTISGYAHWIPITKGLHLEYFRRNYPGWEWNHIIPALIKKGVVKTHSKDPNQQKLSQGLSIPQDVECVVIKRSKHGSRITVHSVIRD